MHVNFSTKEFLRNKESWIYISIAVGAIITIVIAFFTGKRSTEATISNSITIITSVLVSGCILLLVENQHLVGETTSRYHALMRPFYRDLSKISNFINFCLSAIVPKDEKGKQIKDSFTYQCKQIKGYAHYVIISGKTNIYLKTEELNTLCEEINNIWYRFDRDCSITQHISFDSALEDIIRNALHEYDRNATERDIEISILPELAGDFYARVWLPIENVPFFYDSFMKRCNHTEIFIGISIAVEICSLIILLLSQSCSCYTPVFVPILFTTLSVAAFSVSLVKFMTIKRATYILQF
jgi:hypothetical protein